MARIAIGGFQHETNTFAPVKADLKEFEKVAGQPRAPRGEALFGAVAGLNLPISGFIESARSAGHDLIPTQWAMATPSAHVTDRAFDKITGNILEDITSAGKLDAVYLCLHGAMVTESHQDGEGELLRRVRAEIGPDVPVVVSLDLHSNTTQQMVDLSTALVAYRTYPHIDMAETGRRAAILLDRILRDGTLPKKSFRKLPFLIPLVWQCTTLEPSNSIYQRLRAMERVSPSISSLSFTPGFPPADIAECGPAVLAYGDSNLAADEAAEELARMVTNAEGDFAGALFEPDTGVREAMKRYKDKPIVIADTQDNPGAGGASDTVGLLEALVRNDAVDAIFAMVYDPAAAKAAHKAGIGAEINIAIGAGSGQPDQYPFKARFTVEALSDGKFIGTGPMKGGTQYDMGPTAMLRIGGVAAIVTSGKAQVNDQAMLRHLGIDLERQRILAIKSSVHFRADFTGLAGDILIVTAPGPNVADHLALDFRKLRPGVRLTPHGPENQT